MAPLDAEFGVLDGELQPEVLGELVELEGVSLVLVAVVLLMTVLSFGSFELLSSLSVEAFFSQRMSRALLGGLTGTSESATGSFTADGLAPW